MSQLLVAVKSCWKDREAGYHDLIRGTWGQDLRRKGILLRFFLGHEGQNIGVHPRSGSGILKSDEAMVDSPDNYESLPHKTRGICRWAVNKYVGHLFLCDTDTYVSAEKLYRILYRRYDYAGKISRPLGETFVYNDLDRNGQMTAIPECYPWASGGYGYFLSRAAFELVAENYPTGWAEDLWVGQVLGPGMKNGDFIGLDLPANTYSWHHPKHGEIYDYKTMKDWLDQMHKENR